MLHIPANIFVTEKTSFDLIRLLYYLIYITTERIIIMKKGLAKLLILSASYIILLIIIILACRYIYKNNNTPPNITTDAIADVATKSPSDTAMPTTPPSTSSPEPTPQAATGQAIIADGDEPGVADVTPEPDMDPDTWDYIKGGDYNMLYKEDKEAYKTTYELHVNKQMNTVTAYKVGKKGRLKPARAMVCSAGSATPLGTYYTSDKYYWKAMIHGVWAQYATRITGSILFHSVPYDTHEKDTLITNYYNQLGGTASAGCVRLAVKDAKWIIENCKAGTKVVIYNAPDPGPLGKPSAIRIPSNCKWDPTDPDTRNPLNSNKSMIAGVKDRTIERGSGVNYLQDIMAFDKKKGLLSSSVIKVSTKLDPSKVGEYKVTYSFKDSKNKTIKESCTYKVIDTKAPVISGLADTIYTNEASKINKDYIYKNVKVSDNGYTLSKESHIMVSGAGNSFTVTAKDDYGHSTSKEYKVINDTTEPVIKLKTNLKTTLPVTEKVTDSWAIKRINKVSDDKVKLSKSDVKISIRPSGWGMKISYKLKDKAGNQTSVSESVTYETASIVVTSDNIIVDNADDEDEYIQYVKVTSDVTGKKVPYTLKVKSRQIDANEQYLIYNVTITAVYSSSAGKNKTQTTVQVLETTE